jgi:hypothetical protein
MPTIQQLFADIYEAFRSWPALSGREPTEEVVYTELSPEERSAIAQVYYTGLAQIAKVSQVLADDIDRNGSALKLLYKAAGIFKEMLPEKKSFSFPSTAGSLGAAWLFPQAIRYAATPSASAPCYTSYPANSWTLSITAGQPVYLFGDGTNFYKASPQTAKHSMLVIFKNGLVEVGTTPSFQQFRLWFEGVSKYGIYTLPALVDLPIEPNKPIYQYQTPQPLIITYDKGVMWKALPSRTGTAELRILGFVFYEHDLYPDTTWVT